MKRKVGDRIIMREGCLHYYSRGDIGILVRQDLDGDWWADFNNQGNKEVFKEGIWRIGKEDRKIL